MLLIMILTFVYASFTRNYKTLMGGSVLYLRLLLIFLLYTDLMISNILLLMYDTIEAINVFGLFAVTFRSLIGQAIAINISIFTIVNSMINGRYYNPIRFVFGLYTRLLIKLIDITFFLPLSLLVSTLFSDVYNIRMSVLSPKEAEELNEEMRTTLQQLNKISFSLQKTKMENKDLDLIVDNKGNLEIEVSENTKLSEDELSKLAQKVMVSDRCYNSQLEKYRELVEKDVKQNNGELSSVFNRRLDSIDGTYKKLFVFDK